MKDHKWLVITICLLLFMATGCGAAGPHWWAVTASRPSRRLEHAGVVRRGVQLIFCSGLRVFPAEEASLIFSATAFLSTFSPVTNWQVNL